MAMVFIFAYQAGNGVAWSKTQVRKWSPVAFVVRANEATNKCLAFSHVAANK